MSSCAITRSNPHPNPLRWSERGHDPLLDHPRLNNVLVTKRESVALTCVRRSILFPRLPHRRPLYAERLLNPHVLRNWKFLLHIPRLLPQFS
jgi:hypothetical protein